MKIALAVVAVVSLLGTEASFLDVIAPQEASTAPATAADPSRFATIESVLAELYASISGPVGHKRDPERLKALFMTGARLLPATPLKDGKRRLAALSVDEYIERAFGYMEQKGFFESQIHAVTESFGHVAHVFSTYESRDRAEAEPFARGINSIQLINDGERWWIASIAWDQESEAAPIPTRYGPR